MSQQQPPRENQPNRPVVARQVSAPQQPPRPPQTQQPGVDIRTVAAELFEIRKILQVQAERITTRSHRAQSAGCLLIFVGILHFLAGMNTGRDPLVTAGLLAIAIGVALITR